MTRKRFWLMLLMAGLLCAMAWGWSQFQPAPRLSAVDIALADTREILTTIGQSLTKPGYPEDCYAVLRQLLESNNGEYTLTVKSVFDPDDPQYGYGSNGSASAEIEVAFPDGMRVELSFYARTWVGCQFD